MPWFGAHMSVAGGLHLAIERALEVRSESLQVFTKNANQWRGRPLTDEQVRTFRTHRTESKLRCVVAHDSYLINLAAVDDELYQRSFDAFMDEYDRAERLGIDYLVTHPGAATTSTEDAALERVGQALQRILAATPNHRTHILLETTAGQGTSLGHRFEHLARLREMVNQSERVGVCFDTCHVFAAGYDLRTPELYQATMQQFDEVVGLRWLKLFHVNDSLKPFGSRVDRHAHIGRGEIGLRAFAELVNDHRFTSLPMILETPKEGEDGEEMDAHNLATLRELCG